MEHKKHTKFETDLETNVANRISFLFKQWEELEREITFGYRRVIETKDPNIRNIYLDNEDGVITNLIKIQNNVVREYLSQKKILTELNNEYKPRGFYNCSYEGSWGVLLRFFIQLKEDIGIPYQFNVSCNSDEIQERAWYELGYKELYGDYDTFLAYHFGKVSEKFPDKYDDKAKWFDYKNQEFWEINKYILGIKGNVNFRDWWFKKMEDAYEDDFRWYGEGYNSYEDMILSKGVECRYCDNEWTKEDLPFVKSISQTTISDWYGVEKENPKTYNSVCNGCYTSFQDEIQEWKDRVGY